MQKVQYCGHIIIPWRTKVCTIFLLNIASKVYNYYDLKDELCFPGTERFKCTAIQMLFIFYRTNTILLKCQMSMQNIGNIKSKITLFFFLLKMLLKCLACEQFYHLIDIVHCSEQFCHLSFTVLNSGINLLKLLLFWTATSPFYITISKQWIHHFCHYFKQWTITVSSLHELDCTSVCSEQSIILLFWTGLNSFSSEYSQKFLIPREYL